MPLSKAIKEQVMSEYKVNGNDTGSQHMYKLRC